MPLNAGGRWVPAPGVTYAPRTPTLAGVWADVTLDGPGTISTSDGFTYRVPLLADVQMVAAARGLQIAHVRSEGQVYVFARGLQLVESEQERRARATPKNWSALRYH